MTRSVDSASSFSRRQWLRGGGAAAASLLVPPVLQARETSRRSGNAKSSPAKSAIVIYLQGGLSHYESFDPKPLAPSPIAASFSRSPRACPARTSASTCRCWPAGPIKFNVLRSVYVDSPSHPVAIHMTLTGWDMPGPTSPARTATSRIRRSAVGSRGCGRITARDLPPYVAIPHDAQLGIRVRYATAGLLGAAYEPVFAGLPPESADRHLRTAARLCGFTPRLNAERVQQRLSLLDAIDAPRAGRDPGRSLDTYHRQAYDMLAGDAAGAAFDLDRESPSLRDRYGDHLWGQQTILARRLAESGVPFTLVNFTLNQDHGQDWDTHVDNFGLMRNTLLPPMDRAVSTLLDDLEDRGLLDTTLVAMFGEFGRTPQINSQGGRDHWNKVCSVMLAGGGLKKGVILGSSTQAGDVPLDRPIHFNDVLATIYHQLGVPTDRSLSRPAQPPVPGARPRPADPRVAGVS